MFRLLKYSAFGVPARGVVHARRPRRRRAPSALSARRPVRPRHEPARREAAAASPGGDRGRSAAVRALAVVEACRRPNTDASAMTSAAVRLALAADEAGIDVAGAQLVLGGEPTTEARQEVIARSGIVAVPRYGSMETGPIGYACLAPAAADDVHLLRDLHAVVQARGSVESLPPDALLVSSLASSSPFTFINISLGDAGLVEERSCGCAFERPGLTVHLRDIRSFEKLDGHRRDVPRRRRRARARGGATAAGRRRTDRLSARGERRRERSSARDAGRPSAARRARRRTRSRCSRGGARSRATAAST